MRASVPKSNCWPANEGSGCRRSCARFRSRIDGVSTCGRKDCGIGRSRKRWTCRWAPFLFHWGAPWRASPGLTGGNGMQYEEPHLSDQELALAVDGELSSGREAEVRRHLQTCWECRARLHAMESAIDRLVDLHRRSLEPRLPPIAGPRALLRARLAEASARPDNAGIHAYRRYGLAAALAASLVVAAVGLREWSGSRVQAADAPTPRLTPGATIPLTRDDVCRADSIAPQPAVPVSLQRQVFQEYGIANPRPDAYEVDYLITPELGGATSIRNLWPQPYFNTTWHAGIKDQLERRLHAMVCSGEIDLATAQRDLATNWIEAYKKYFHTDRPIGGEGGPRPKKSVTWDRPRDMLSSVSICEPCSFCFSPGSHTPRAPAPPPERRPRNEVRDRRGRSRTHVRLLSRGGNRSGTARPDAQACRATGSFDQTGGCAGRDEVP